MSSTDERAVRVGTFAALVVSLALNAIVAVGNCRLYSRMERIETILGLRAMPQSRQISQLPRQPKIPE